MFPATNLIAALHVAGPAGEPQWKTILAATVPLLAVLLGFWLREIWDSFREARLEIVSVVGPFSIRRPIGSSEAEAYRAYRVRLRNAKRKLLSRAAENCMAWITIDGTRESYWISWVGGADVSKVTMNIGDERDVDLIAVGTKSGEIIAPTERGYFNLEPRYVGGALHDEAVGGTFRVTSSNAGAVQCRANIRRSMGQGAQWELQIDLSSFRRE